MLISFPHYFHKKTLFSSQLVEGFNTMSKAIQYGQFPMDNRYVEPDYHESDAEDDDETYSERTCTKERPDRDTEQSFAHDATGLIHYYFYEAKRILTSPSESFEEMPAKGGFAGPAIFLSFSALIYAFINAVGRLNPIVFFVSFFSSVIYVSVGSLIASKVFSIAFGGKGDFESTFRVFAYSKATLLFAWVSVGSLQVGGWAAVAYTLILNAIGISKVHDMPKHKALGIVLCLALLQLAVKSWLKV